MKRHVGVPVDENNLGEIPINSFYGSLNRKEDLLSKSKRLKLRTRWESQLEKLEKVEAEFRSNPLTESYKPRLNDPCILRQTFFKQKDAFDFVSDGLHVFSFESPSAAIPNTGRRQYLVCSYVQFYHYYKQLKHKHHYEVIPEGQPCRLYFDLEYAIEHNPESDGDFMVESLVKIVNHKLYDLYDVRCDRTMIVDMSATTESKFSRHLVYHLPDRAVFADNIQAGNFVNHVCAEMMGVLARATEQGAAERLGASLAEVRSLVVKNKDGGDTLFCDLAVYTKNRNFRLLHSTKRGRRNPLVLAEQCKFLTQIGTDDTTSPEHQLFLDSLISNVSMTDDTRVLTCDDGCRLQYRRSSPRVATPTTAVARPPLDGAGASPYPEVDAFIRTRIQDGGGHVTGGVRRWSYFGDLELLLYEVHTYRYCENVGRHHQSNNIMLLVDLRRGVYYQKCHDPECQRVNYKSQDYPVPDRLLPKHYLDSSLDSDFSDQSDSERPTSDQESEVVDEHQSERRVVRQQSDSRSDDKSERQIADEHSRSDTESVSERRVVRPESDDFSSFSDHLDVTDDDLLRVVENAEIPELANSGNIKTEPEMEITEPEMVELTDDQLLAAVGKLEESFSR